ncbi:hypothetical protein B0H14DRAFT_2898819, partial [Mycena olivaceomarginata]
VPKPRFCAVPRILPHSRGAHGPRGTLQYVGFAVFMAVLGKTRWLAADVKDALVARIKEVCAFPSDSESARIVSGMRWMGPFSPEKLVVHGGTLLDTLERHRHARRWCRPHGERAAVHHQELTSTSPRTRTKCPSPLTARSSPVANHPPLGASSRTG